MTFFYHLTSPESISCGLFPFPWKFICCVVLLWYYYYSSCVVNLFTVYCVAFTKLNFLERRLVKLTKKLYTVAFWYSERLRSFGVLMLTQPFMVKLSRAAISGARLDFCRSSKAIFSTFALRSNTVSITRQKPYTLEIYSREKECR